MSTKRLAEMSAEEIRAVAAAEGQSTTKPGRLINSEPPRPARKATGEKTKAAASDGLLKGGEVLIQGDTLALGVGRGETILVFTAIVAGFELLPKGIQKLVINGLQKRLSAAGANAKNTTTDIIAKTLDSLEDTLISLSYNGYHSKEK